MGKEGYEGMERGVWKVEREQGIYRYGWNEARTRRSTCGAGVQLAVRVCVCGCVDVWACMWV